MVGRILRHSQGISFSNRCFHFGLLLCSTSINLPELVAMRVLQGIGGSMMVPVGRLAVIAKTAKADMMKMISYIVWPGLIPPVLAPLGRRSDHYPTPAGAGCFLINVPLGRGSPYGFAVTAHASPTLIDKDLLPSMSAGVVLTGERSRWTGIYVRHLLSEQAPPWIAVAMIGVASLGLIAWSIRHLLTHPGLHW